MVLWLAGWVKWLVGWMPTVCVCVYVYVYVCVCVCVCVCSSVCVCVHTQFLQLVLDFCVLPFFCNKTKQNEYSLLGSRRNKKVSFLNSCFNPRTLMHLNRYTLSNLSISRLERRPEAVIPSVNPAGFRKARNLSFDFDG